MNATQQLHDLGQSLWLDNITRSVLTSGTLARNIKDLALTGLTSNPTIFEQAIGKSDACDEAIRRQAGAGESGEALFFGLPIDDLTRAADLFRPGPGRGLAGDDATAAADIVDREALPQCLAPALGDGAGHEVAAATGGHRHDVAHWPRRKYLGLGRC